MAQRFVVYIVVFLCLFVDTASGKIHLSEVHYSPAKDGPPAFIELYNSSDSNEDLSGWIVEFCESEVVAFALPSGSEIPSYGFFLIGFEKDKEAWAGFSYKPDFYAECEFGKNMPGGVILYDDSAEYVDCIGWGIAPAGYYEGEPFVLVSGGHSVERKSGPEHSELRGNSYDTEDNLNDCRERSTPQHQNIYSPREHPSLNAEDQSIGYIKAMYDYQ